MQLLNVENTMHLQLAQDVESQLLSTLYTLTCRIAVTVYETAKLYRLVDDVVTCSRSCTLLMVNFTGDCYLTLKRREGTFTIAVYGVDLSAVAAT